MPFAAVLQDFQAVGDKKKYFVFEKFFDSFVALNNFCHTDSLFETIAFTQADDSIVHGRTVSVRPSRKSRVIDASYVNENLPASLKMA